MAHSEAGFPSPEIPSQIPNTPECEPLAEPGLALREWTFLERYPELALYMRHSPRAARKLEQHYLNVCEFTEKFVAPRALEIDRRMAEDPDYVPQDILDAACKYKLYSGIFPAFLGGPGLHVFASFLTSEVISTRCVGIANLLGVSGLAISAVMASYDPRALSTIADLICGNERRGIPTFLSTCNTEPGAGSDAEDADEFEKAKIITTAVRVEGGYRVSGTKVFISNASIAALHVVIAFTGKLHRPEDIVLLMVPRGAKGVTVSRAEKKMGQKACAACEVVFDDVFVPDMMVCRTGDGADGGFAKAGVANVLSMTRTGVGAFATGVAEGAYRTALQYVRDSSQSQQPLEQRQWVRAELADMAMRAQVARSTYVSALMAVCNVGALKLLERTGGLDVPAWVGSNPVFAGFRRYLMGTAVADRLFKWIAARQTFDERELATAMGDVSKVNCSELAMENCQSAVSLMGKDGLRHEYGAEKLLRDVKLLQIYEGTNQINTLDFVKRRINRQFACSLDPKG